MEGYVGRDDVASEGLSAQEGEFFSVYNMTTEYSTNLMLLINIILISLMITTIRRG